jgi:hypothetical protein
LITKDGQEGEAFPTNLAKDMYAEYRTDGMSFQDVRDYIVENIHEAQAEKKALSDAAHLAEVKASKRR